MLLTSDQYTDISGALLEAFPTYSSLSNMLLKRLGRNLQQITLAPDLTSVVWMLIGTAAAGGWIVELLHAAHEENPTNQRLAALEIAFQPVAALLHLDPYDICMLRTTRAFVNRKLLREALRDLADPQGARILIIEGPPASGKTYSVQLISFLKDRLQTFFLIPILLQQQFQGMEITPYLLAETIVRQLDLKVEEMPPFAKEQASRWVQVFCDWLTGRLQEKTNVYYIVIDDFGHTEIPDSAMALIQELAIRIDLNLSNLRLILVGFSDVLPLSVEGGIQHEPISAIGESDLQDFFIKLYAQRNKAYQPADVAQAVASVLRQVDTNDPKRLRAMGAAVAEIAKTI